MRSRISEFELTKLTPMPGLRFSPNGAMGFTQVTSPSSSMRLLPVRRKAQLQQVPMGNGSSERMKMPISLMFWMYENRKVSPLE